MNSKVAQSNYLKRLLYYSTTFKIISLSVLNFCKMPVTRYIEDVYDYKYLKKRTKKQSMYSSNTIAKI